MLGGKEHKNGAWMLYHLINLQYYPSPVPTHHSLLQLILGLGIEQETLSVDQILQRSHYITKQKRIVKAWIMHGMFNKLYFLDVETNLHRISQ